MLVASFLTAGETLEGMLTIKLSGWAEVFEERLLQAGRTVLALDWRAQRLASTVDPFNHSTCDLSTQTGAQTSLAPNFIA